MKGSFPPLKDQITAYVVVAVLYLSVATPIFTYSPGLTLPHWLWSFLLNIGLPAICGLSLVYADKFKIIYKVAKLLGLKLIHHVPTAWDYTFENIASGSYVIIHLTDGQEIPGALGADSFISSTSDERDVLLSSVWEIDQTGVWKEALPRRSLLICAGEIRSIEIF